MSTLQGSFIGKDWLMDEAKKSQLSEALWKIIGGNDLNLLGNAWHILVDGLLRQIIPWKKWQKFENICQSYVNHVLRLYGTTVVFQDYHGSPSKYITHLRKIKDRKS